MISYIFLWYHSQYHKMNYKKPFLRYFHGISYMISDMILQKSYVFGHDIRYLWYYSWYHGTFHMKSPMISVTYDIDAVWYHTFRDIVVYIMATGLDILAYIMAPGRRDGAGWGRHAPAAPPPPDSPSPTYWGRVLSWTATDLIQLLSNCLLYTLAYSHSYATTLLLSKKKNLIWNCDSPLGSGQELKLISNRGHNINGRDSQVAEQLYSQVCYIRLV